MRSRWQTASVSQENIDTVLRVIEAINRRDAEAALLELHEDAEYLDHRASSREEFRGKDAFRTHFEAIWRGAEDVRIDANPVAHPGDFVVVKQSVSATDRGGRPTRSVRWVTRTLRDGLITRVEVFDGEREALEAAGRGE